MRRSKSFARRVIEPQYDHAGDFNEEGVADVELDGQEIKIDMTGKQVQ